MEAITVKELIEILNQQPDDMKIGKVGYFGEFKPMYKYNFYTETAFMPDPNNKNYQSWREIVRRECKEKILNVDGIDLGEEPD